jgi:hypothetical protein
MKKTSKYILTAMVLCLGLSFNAYGKPKKTYVFKMIAPAENLSNAFRDDIISVQFTLSETGINFALGNVSDQPLKILWNDVSYIDIGKVSHRVMHSGIQYDERSNAMPPVSVPPNSAITDVIVPTDYVFFSKGIYTQYFTIPASWQVTPFFPPPNKKEALFFNGRTFEIYLPIEIGGSVKNYRFTFEIHVMELVKGK